MRKDEIQVIGVANISDIAYSINCEKKAMALILEIDAAQEDSGFTETVIVTLIKAMKKEYKGDQYLTEEFNKLIRSAL